MYVNGEHGCAYSGDGGRSRNPLSSTLSIWQRLADRVLNISRGIGVHWHRTYWATIVYAHFACELDYRRKFIAQ